MRDYIGDIEYFQNQLLRKGITKEMFDISIYAGLTARELQRIVDKTFVDLSNLTLGTAEKRYEYGIETVLADGGALA